jgi:hypothetical protein
VSIIFRKENIKYILIAVLVGIIVFVGLYVPSCTKNNANGGTTIDEVTPDEVVTTTETISSSVVETTSEVIETTTESLIIVDKSPQTGYLDEPTEPVYEFVPSPERDDYEYELDLLARCIYQESGCCSEYCQWLVGSTVMNLGEERGCGIEIVFDYNTFNVAYVLYSCTPSDTSYAVAERILSGDRDYNVMAFRTDYYHPFGNPYTNVDNVYFSTF